MKFTDFLKIQENKDHFIDKNDNLDSEQIPELRGERDDCRFGTLDSYIRAAAARLIVSRTIGRWTAPRA